MRRFRLGLLMAAVLMVMSATALWAAEGKGSLVELHKGKAKCADCHGSGKKIAVDDSEASVNKGCIGCHGTLEEMGKHSKEEVNPHRSHLGEINCTACHHGHTASYVYCLNCHSFDMKIPAGGAKAAEKAPAKQKGKMRTEKADVVVIGAGAAGFTTAITAHDAGAKVVIIEKQPITGGNSMLAAGGMNAAETVFQKKKGIKDSVELMYKDTMVGGGELNDPALAMILAKNSASSVDWLTSLGADLSDVGRMGGASVDRTHRPKGGSAVGAHIINVLRKNAADRKIDIRMNSKVVKIVEDAKGNVTGVVVEGKHSGPYTINAKAVVITAGGFSANPERVAYYRPEYKGMTTSNQPGATGDGIDLGTAVGADVKDMKEIQIHPTVAAGSRILITEAVRGNGAILVNQEGKRFVNELTTRDKASAAILAQTGKSAYLVFDEGVRQSLKQIDGYFHLDLVQQGATVRGLAAALKVPADALEATIANYNKAVETKTDAEFKRPDMPRPLKTPKYYAIAVKPGVHYTMGGLKITTESEVVAKDGKPIPGLFAAGEGTGGVHGKNRLGGNSISQTVTFGRIAGASAVKCVKGVK
ncbi:flavocytochrome c [Geomonas sp. RF6]|uniref:flavocytochrome c n=1 Tax=Geomonas sp. RF6 TaxID=2897342 RepID=UPI001E5C472E|nr:flavocytochrome c [Geomonas sp. RF6]UFS69028.1 flavocytochrome c [Geomonas sp. RF6]